MTKDEALRQIEHKRNAVTTTEGQLRTAQRALAAAIWRGKGAVGGGYDLTSRLPSWSR
jgi:hypothetical protein